MKFWCIHKRYNLGGKFFENWHYETEDPKEINRIKSSWGYGSVFKEESKDGALPLDILGSDFLRANPEASTLNMSKMERVVAKEKNIETLEKTPTEIKVERRELNPEQVAKLEKLNEKAKKKLPDGYEDDNGIPFTSMANAKKVMFARRKRGDTRKREAVRNPFGRGWLLKVE